MRTYHIFHVNLLELVAIDPPPSQQITPPLLVDVDGEQEWEVSEVLDARMFQRWLQCLMQWTGYNATS
jgi:hypothetical protein